MNDKTWKKPIATVLMKRKIEMDQVYYFGTTMVYAPKSKVA